MKKLMIAAVATMTATSGLAGSSKLQDVDLKPYDRANYPKLFAKYGETGVLKDIQDVREAGAMEMAKETKCDRVLFSDYSDKSTSEQIVVFVDCANGYRVWYGGGRILRTAQNAPLE